MTLSGAVGSLISISSYVGSRTPVDDDDDGGDDGDAVVVNNCDDRVIGELFCGCTTKAKQITK